MELPTAKDSVSADPAGPARLHKVVIIACDPEHRNDGSLPLPFKYAGAGGRGERLVNRVERPGEQSGLLAGGDGHCSRLCQAVQRRRSWREGVDGGGGQVPGESMLSWRREILNWSEWSGHDPEGHQLCPTRMVRGAPGVSGEAS
jgi:hypothetical protein